MVGKRKQIDGYKTTNPNYPCPEGVLEQKQEDLQATDHNVIFKIESYIGNSPILSFL